MLMGRSSDKIEEVDEEGEGSQEAKDKEGKIEEVDDGYGDKKEYGYGVKKEDCRLFIHSMETRLVKKLTDALKNGKLQRIPRARLLARQPPRTTRWRAWERSTQAKSACETATKDNTVAGMKPRAEERQVVEERRVVKVRQVVEERKEQYRAAEVQRSCESF